MGTVGIDLWKDKPALEFYMQEILIPQLANISLQRNRMPGEEKSRTFHFVRVHTGEKPEEYAELPVDEEHADLVYIRLVWSTVAVD